MIEPTTPEEDETFNEIERMSKVKQELVKQQLDRLENDVAQLKAKTQQEFYDELRNGVIEEVAMAIEHMRGFGSDTISSFATYVRWMKK
jgi:gas vesicle protein